MEIKELQKKLLVGVKKYKFPLLILLIGLAFMLMPNIEKKQSEIETNDKTEAITLLTDEERLTNILRNVHGAGEVVVMLTAAAGEETIYQTNDNQSTGTDTYNSSTDTVTVTDSQRNESALIRQINPVRYQGAVVVCAGADDPVVQLAMVDAVSKATGLGANQISVLKMK